LVTYVRCEGVVVNQEKNILYNTTSFICHKQGFAPERNPKPKLTQINIIIQNPYIQNELKKINTQKIPEITRNLNN